MNWQGKLLVMVLCGLSLSGCIVPKARFDEALAKCALTENSLRSKEQEVAALEAEKKSLGADAEKARQLCGEELSRAKTAQGQVDAELLKTRGLVVDKDKELLATKNELLEKNKELLAAKEEMARKLLEKDKQNENLIYTIREIQSRAESLLEKIKTIQ